MSAMTELALPADVWTEATGLGDSVEVTIGALGPVGILAYVGPSLPGPTTFVGRSIDVNADKVMNLEAADKIFCRSRVPGIAARVFVWPHAAPA